MNIFFLESEIDDCAKSHVDKHVVKMRVEYAQLACTAHHIMGTEKSTIPYKETHKNHPSAIWTRESLSNYLYVVTLGLALCEEMRIRFGTINQKTESVLEWCKINLPDIEDKSMTTPKLAVPIDLMSMKNENFNDSVNIYRECYKTHKQPLHKWTNNVKPNWI